MSRTVIDLDDETTAELMRIYNVTTKAAAVRRAMRETVMRHRRFALMDAIASGEIDLTSDARTARRDAD